MNLLQGSQQPPAHLPIPCSSQVRCSLWTGAEQNAQGTRAPRLKPVRRPDQGRKLVVAQPKNASETPSQELGGQSNTCSPPPAPPTAMQHGLVHLLTEILPASDMSPQHRKKHAPLDPCHSHRAGASRGPSLSYSLSKSLCGATHLEHPVPPFREAKQPPGGSLYI